MELAGKRIALLVAQDFEDSEALYPYYRLQEAGAEVAIVGVGGTPVVASKHSYPLTIDHAVEDVEADAFDGLIIPGGYSPDRVRASQPALDLVRRMDDAGKPIAAICHAGWVLISARIISGRRATCYHTIKDDLVNAGALYEDSEVVVDGNLVTARQPADLPAFCRELIASFSRQSEVIEV
ncbi:MAG: type 1 glutamine amidotransferase [Planctomycetes bacterium]|nr:type 1 glutamine amidotransferase [Planctomycetota bacterium]